MTDRPTPDHLLKTQRGEPVTLLEAISEGLFEALVRKVAADEGLGVVITYDDVFDACVNHPEAVQILAHACAQAGVQPRLTTVPQRFSEDFGQFAKGSKTAMFWLGAGVDHPQLHNPDYDFPDALIPVGAGIFLAAIRQVLDAPVTV